MFVRLIVLCFMAHFFWGCTRYVTDFFPDDYLESEKIYHNPALGFNLRYSANWQINTTSKTMSKTQREVATLLHNSGSELLYVGKTSEGLHASRAIVDHLNLSNENYLEVIRKVASIEPGQELGAEEQMIAGVPMIRWFYLHRGHAFVEYLLRIDTYNIRVAFWSSPAMFRQFLPVYDQIMATFEQY